MTLEMQIPRCFAASTLGLVFGCGGSALTAPGPSPDAAAEGASLDCVGGTVACGPSCVELASDPANCGACGVSCGVDGVCVNATCTKVGGGETPPDAESPPEAQDASDSGIGSGPGVPDGGPADSAVLASPDGGVDSAVEAGPVPDAGPCAPGQTLCLQRCVDVSTDSNNCGACGAACAARQACALGVCGCASGSVSCGGVCVGALFDSVNCGACGSACDAGSVCSGGVCGAASSDWPTFAYDARHSGANAAETAVPPPTDSWATRVSPTGSALGPVAAESGRAFVTYGGGFAAVAPITALDVSDGTALWNYNFGAVDSVGYPSVANGTVYVQTNHGTATSTSYLWALDAAAGTVSWAAAFGSQWESFWPPLVIGSTVFIDGGEYGGLYGFKTVDGSQTFFNSSIGQYDSWSPAYFGGEVYTFIDGNLCAEDPASGDVLSTTTVTWNWDGYSMDTAPVFDDTQAYVIAPPNLDAIDPATSTVAWTANGTYAGTPAVAGGIVYGISAGNLIARNAATGTLAFTLVGDQNLKYPPVLAAGYVYASSDSNVYAWNVSTHAQAWTAPVGGWLAIAAGRLLVSGTDGILRGFILSN
jgi:hypothetical protein